MIFFQKKIPLNCRGLKLGLRGIFILSINLVYMGIVMTMAPE
jgi:hypothetical protein